MPAHARRLVRSPSPTRRALSLGSLLGAGVLLAGTAAAPAALAGQPAGPGGGNGSSGTAAKGQQDATTSSAPLDQGHTGGQVQNSDQKQTGAGTDASADGAAGQQSGADGLDNGVGNGGQNNGGQNNGQGNGQAIGGYFGTGKVYIDGPASAPPDYAYSGNEFTITKTDEPHRGAQFTCTSAGTTCTFDEVPVGTYDVVQSLTTAGLVAAHDVARLTTGDCRAAGDAVGLCRLGYSTTAAEGSDFQRSVTVRVTDGQTRAPLAGAGYELSGPAYPRTAAAAAAPGTFLLGSALPPGLVGLFGSPTSGAATVNADGAQLTYTAPVSDDLGVVTFSGWFLPGTWTLSPGQTPLGYTPAAGTVRIPSAAAVDVALTRASTTGTGTTAGQGSTVPGTTDPGSTVPVTTDPGSTVPVTTDPGTTVPVTTDPGITVPVTTDPVTPGSGTVDPAVTVPGTNDSGTAIPAATDPGATTPATTGTTTTDPTTPGSTTTVSTTTGSTTTGSTTTGSTTTGSTTTGSTTTTPQGPAVPAPAAAAAGVNGSGQGAAGSSRATAGSGAARTVASAGGAVVPGTGDGSTGDSAPGTTVSSPGAPVARADGVAAPRLQTQSATLPQPALIALGVLFVAVVWIAFLLLRRRARRS